MTTIIQFDKSELQELIEDSIRTVVLELTKPTPEPLQDKIDIKEVKRMTGQGNSWVYKKTFHGCQDPLPYEKFGKRLVFSRKAIQEYIDNHTIRPANPADEMANRLAKSAKKHLNKY